MTSQNIKVYYDGLCHFCSREIDHYKKLKGAENLQFIDITNAAFDPVAENLDPHEVHKSLHVRDVKGQLHVGVDAFIRIWSELAGFKRLVPIAKARPVYAVLKFFYAGFAKIRPLLPRKSCDTSPYCEVHSKS